MASRIQHNNNNNNKVIFQIRGGALSLPKKSDVAKVATVISLIQGAVAFLNPSSIIKGYGMEITSSPLVESITRRLGVLLLQMGILGLFLFFGGRAADNLNTAIGFATLGFAVETARSLLANEHKKIGFAAGPQIGVMIECAAVSYVNLMKLNCSGIANKFHLVWVALNGFAFAFLPKPLVTMGYGMESPDTKMLAMISGFGYWMIAYAVYFGTLVLGNNNDDPGIQALTFNRIAILLIHVLPSPGGDAIGMDKTKQAVLFAYQALILVGLLAL